MTTSTVPDLFHIGELAAAAGLTPDTLRYYERIGLLPKPQRTAGGFRVYPARALDRVRFIRQAQTLGLSLREIRDVVAYQDRGGLGRCRQVRDLLRTKLAELQARLAELEAFRDTVDAYLAVCERTLAAGRVPAERPEPECPVFETTEGRGRSDDSRARTPAAGLGRRGAAPRKHRT